MSDHFQENERVAEKKRGNHHTRELDATYKKEEEGDNNAKDFM